MPSETCPTCGKPQDAPPTQCAKCGVWDRSGAVEPFGWSYVDTGETVMAPLFPDGSTFPLKRRVLVCENCLRGWKPENEV